jgi:MtN3 and saliva related transmembrane protein
MFNNEIFGYISGIISALSILPQIYKSYNTRSSKDLSTKTFILTYIAYGFAITYGILIKHVAIYVMNTIGCILYIILHSIKIYNEHYISSTYNELDSLQVQNVELNETTV